MATLGEAEAAVLSAVVRLREGNRQPNSATVIDEVVHHLVALGETATHATELASQAISSLQKRGTLIGTVDDLREVWQVREG